MRVNPNVSYELWVLMTCPGGFSGYNKRTTLGRDVDLERGFLLMGDVGSLYVSLSFSVSFKLFEKVILKEKKKRKKSFSTLVQSTCQQP